MRRTVGTAPASEESDACLELDGATPLMQNLPEGQYNFVVRTPRESAGMLFAYTLEIEGS